MITKLLENEKIDDIGFGGKKLIQNPDEFCFGVDAVILASFASEIMQGRRNLKGVDLGTGTGIIPLIIDHKTDIGYMAAVEFQKASAERAARTFEMNDRSGKISVIADDVINFREWGAELKSKIDFVTCNPPYFERGRAVSGSNESKHMARHETTAVLDDFFEAAAFLLKRRGDFFIVHRPGRLADICESSRKHGMEPASIRMVSPLRGKDANIMLVHMIKDGGKNLKVHDSLYVYEKPGEYSRELLYMYEKI